MPIEVRYDMPAAGIGQAAAYGGGAQATMQAAQMMMQQNAAAMQARSHQDDLNARYEEMYLHSADAAAERNARADIASQASGREERVAARQEERDNRLQQGRMDLQDSRFGYRSDLEDQRAGNQAYLSDYRLNSRQQQEADAISRSEQEIERQYANGQLSDRAYQNATQTNQARRMGLVRGAGPRSSGGGGGGGGGGGAGGLNRGSGQDFSEDELKQMRDGGMTLGPLPGTVVSQATGDVLQRDDNGRWAAISGMNRNPRVLSAVEYGNLQSQVVRDLTSSLPAGAPPPSADAVNNRMREMLDQHGRYMQDEIMNRNNPAGTEDRPHPTFTPVQQQQLTGVEQLINSLPSADQPQEQARLRELNNLMVRRGDFSMPTPASERRRRDELMQHFTNLADRQQEAETRRIEEAAQAHAREVAAENRRQEEEAARANQPPPGASQFTGRPTFTQDVSNVAGNAWNDPHGVPQGIIGAGGFVRDATGALIQGGAQAVSDIPSNFDAAYQAIRAGEWGRLIGRRPQD